MAKAPVYWCGSNPTKCDICTRDLKDTFTDGATTWGPWGIMCPDCFKTHGKGLGMGRGQKYQRTSGGWLKTEG